MPIQVMFVQVIIPLFKIFFVLTILKFTFLWLALLPAVKWWKCELGSNLGLQWCASFPFRFSLWRIYVWIVMNSHNDQPLVGLVEHCIDILEVRVQFPFRPEGFRSYFSKCLLIAHNCDDHIKLCLSFFSLFFLCFFLSTLSCLKR